MEVGWTQSFGGKNGDRFRSVIETSDGSIVAAGLSNSADAGFDSFSTTSYSDAIIVKYDSNRDFKWVKNWGGLSTDVFECIVETTDKGLVAVGYSYSTDAGFDYISTTLVTNAIVVKFDKDGNHLWTRSISGTKNDYFKSVIATSDNSVIALGYTTSSDAGFELNGKSDSFLAKYDADGNRTWFRPFGGSGNDFFYGIASSLDGGFVIAGETDSTEVEGQKLDISTGVGAVAKFDKDGNFKWIGVYGGNVAECFESITQVHDGGFVAVGYTFSTNLEFSNNGEMDALIVKFSESGDVVWAKGFGGSGNDAFVYTTSMINNYILIVGESSSTDLGFENKGELDGILVKYDVDGNQVYFESYGGDGDDIFRSVVETKSRDLVAVGFTFSSNIGFPSSSTNADALIVSYTLIRKVSDVDSNVNIIPENMIEFAIVTNDLLFQDFSLEEESISEDVFRITVSSSLPYDINVYLQEDIVGSTFNKKLDNQVISLKSSLDNEYKTFADNSKFFKLLSNQSFGMKNIHDIDAKIDGKKMAIVDIYKILLKIEVQQL
jgi:hypothetical protein